jgi:hypothetical protein
MGKGTRAKENSMQFGRDQGEGGKDSSGHREMEEDGVEKVLMDEDEVNPPKPKKKWEEELGTKVEKAVSRTILS